MDFGANHVRICLYQMFNPLSNKQNQYLLGIHQSFFVTTTKNNAVGHLYCAFEVLLLVDF